MDEAEKHYTVLGLDEDCSTAELEEAYRERAEAWNPGKFAGNEQMRLKAEEKRKHIEEAHEFLRAKLAGPAGGKVATVTLSPEPETASGARPAPAVSAVPIAAPGAVPSAKPKAARRSIRRRVAEFAIALAIGLALLGGVMVLLWYTNW